MHFYDKYILPGLTHRVCSQKQFSGQRLRIFPRARGSMFEVGLDSGLNLPFCDKNQADGYEGSNLPAD
jgi:hypothetical protein